MLKLISFKEGVGGALGAKEGDENEDREQRLSSYEDDESLESIDPMDDIWCDNPCGFLYSPCEEFLGGMGVLIR